MQQVRELLFGAQIKDMEARLQRQEEHFARELSDARDALKSRLDSLENFLKTESASFGQRLQRELAERDSALKSEQQERTEALRVEFERIEQLQSEQRAQADSLGRLARALAQLQENFERKLSSLSASLDANEQTLRELLLSESGSLSGKTEERYQEALRIISDTAAQLRQDLVPRSALAMLFSDVAFKVSGQGDEIAPNAAGLGVSSQPGLGGDLRHG